MFLNEEKKPFHALSGDDMKVVVDAIHKRIPVQIWELNRWFGVGVGNHDIHMSIIYRVPGRPDEIDWSAVHPDYNYMARDENGEVWLHLEKPSKHSDCWVSGGGLWIIQNISVDCVFSSYKNNGLPWDQSLVMRPGVQGE